MEVCAEEEHFGKNWVEAGLEVGETLHRSELSGPGPPVSLLLEAPTWMMWLRTRVQLVSRYAPGPVVITNGIAAYMADCHHSQGLLAHR